MLLEDPLTAPWFDLDPYVENLFWNHLFKVNKSNPITKDSIDDLRWDGWTVIQGEKNSLNFPRRVICLDSSLECYMRDKALFRGIVHAHVAYQEETALDRSKHTKAMVEWIARTLRADPNLLRH